MRAKTPFFNPNKKAPRTVGVVRSAKGSFYSAIRLSCLALKKSSALNSTDKYY
ncbi:uncharacterized protein METZ01_LOCUS400331 [marine metagenome]|uniref:Uncharacterized protein n=1 Tax=marine metagenome TaxID=408172 RepID=A0A382VLS1_9ZZZZ